MLKINIYNFILNLNLYIPLDLNIAIFMIYN